MVNYLRLWDSMEWACRHARKYTGQRSPNCLGLYDQGIYYPCRACTIIRNSRLYARRALPLGTPKEEVTQVTLKTAKVALRHWEAKLKIPTKKRVSPYL